MAGLKNELNKRNRRGIELVRRFLARYFGQQEERDIVADCRVSEPTYQNLQSFFAFIGIANRIGKLIPNSTWSNDIVVRSVITDANGNESDDDTWNKAWQDFAMRYSPFTLLNRLDILLAYSPYAVLRFGIQDGREPTEEAGQHTTGLDNLFFTIHSSQHATVTETDNDPSSPRNGFPQNYKLTINSFDTRLAGQGGGTIGTNSYLQCHASRCLHVAENKLESNVYGDPRLQAIYYDFVQLVKTLFAGGESMYQRARMPYVITQSGESDDTDENGQDSLAIAEDMVNDILEGGFGQAIGIQEGDLKSVTANVPNIAPMVDTFLKMVFTSTGIPQRVLTGEGLAQFTASNDAALYNNMIEQRQMEFAAPEIGIPFVLRLIDFNVLPKTSGTIKFEFPTLIQEEASNKAKRAHDTVLAMQKLAQIPISDRLCTDEQFVDEFMPFEYHEDELNEWKQKKQKEVEEAMPDMEQDNQIDNSDPMPEMDNEEKS